MASVRIVVGDRTGRITRSGRLGRCAGRPVNGGETGAWLEGGPRLAQLGREHAALCLTFSSSSAFFVRMLVFGREGQSP